MSNTINKSTILRLARYLRVLQKLKTLGFVKVFSNNLGDALNVTPAVVRKDFSIINIPGNKRGGYNIDLLIQQLSSILGKDKPHKVVLAGCGRIGSALMKYKEFGKEGIQIVAGFDSDPTKLNPDASIPRLDIQEMGEFIKKHQIHIGIIAVPDTAAFQVLEVMVNSGVLGILNFAPVELKGYHGCIINNVNIGLEIENLFYLVHMAQKHPDKISLQSGHEHYDFS